MAYIFNLKGYDWPMNTVKVKMHEASQSEDNGQDLRERRQFPLLRTGSQGQHTCRKECTHLLYENEHSPL